MDDKLIARLWRILRSKLEDKHAGWAPGYLSAIEKKLDHAVSTGRNLRSTAEDIGSLRSGADEETKSLIETINRELVSALSTGPTCRK